MAARQYSLLLTDASFPFRLDLAGESYIADEIPVKSSPPVVPKVLYLNNVLPATQGYDSLDTRIVAPAVEASTFDRVYEFFGDEHGLRHLFSPAYGKGYVLRDGDAAWTAALDLPGSPEFSLAQLRNRTYFFFRGNAMYRYDETGREFFPIALEGLLFSGLVGITAATNYFIGFDESTIYYTSRIEVDGSVDFTPTLGVAGSLQVLAVGGKILHCLPYANGFIVYTQTNAIMASYSGNPNLPFTFREIPGSSGVLQESNVAWNNNTGVHFAWTRSGMQQVEPNRASNMLPSLLDYIRQRTTEVLNSTTGALEYTESEEQFVVRLTLVSHRFLCISYGAQTPDPQQQVFSDCLVYDVELQRWGRFFIPHVSIFSYTFTGGFELLSYQALLDTAVTYDDLEFTRYNALTTEDPGARSLGYRIGALGLDGQITVFERSNMTQVGSAAGEILLGKLSAFVGNATEIQEIRTQTSTMEQHKLFTYLFGDSLQTPTYVKDCVKANYPQSLGDERFLVRSTGKNHALYFKGRFHLTDVDVWMLAEGDR